LRDEHALAVTWKRLMPDKNVFDRYLLALRKTKIDEKTEHTDRAALQALLQAFAEESGNGTAVQHEPKRVADKGAPDFKITSRGLILGYVENKAIGEHLDKVLKSDQITRYKTLSQNIILTDYLHFIWISKDGIQRETLCHVTDLENSKFRLHGDRTEAVAALLRAFLSTAPEGIGRAQQLALALATRSKLLHDYLGEELVRQERDHKEGRLYGLYQIFRDQVFHELTLNEFADAFAQMLAYGLFLARLNSGSEPVTLHNAREHVPGSFRLIRELVDFLTELEKDEYRDVRWVVEEVLSIVNALNLPAIHEDLSFRNRKANNRKVRAGDEEEHRLFERDPFIYFYEDYLKAYDAATRKARGVYYTPPPVVNFIVRAMDDILKESFDIRDGLADHRRVTVLDFACGTGTFLLEVFQRVFDNIGGPGSGRADPIVREHILKNLFGFEYLIAPYTIAHLKLSQYLREQGHPLKNDERLQVFLTNTLEPVAPQANFLLPAVSAEVEAAQKVKDREILVIMGNPPYSGVSRNMGTAAQHLIERYKYVDGQHFGERKHWLQDDYVKFIAFAQKKMDEVEEGIVGIITNHNYLDGPTFRGMRQQLLSTFNQIFVLDLHGSAQRTENVPLGTRDENVFDIRPGVAIILLVKNRKIEGSVRHANLWGRREAKYRVLAQNSIRDIEWKVVRPVSPNYFFEEEIEVEDVANGRSLDEMFTIGTTALQTSRDEFALSFSESDLIRRVKDLRNLDKPDTEFTHLLRKKKESQLPAGDSGFWNLKNARKELNERSSVEIAPLMYRPFDIRYLIYDDAIVHRMKREVSDQMRQDNLSLLVPRQLSSMDYRHVFVTTLVSEMCVVSAATKEQNRVFPLYRYELTRKQDPASKKAVHNSRVENFSADFREFLDGRYEHHYTPEEVFGYVYAVLHAPTHRERYADFLRIDFPNVPFPLKAPNFETLSVLGWSLVQAHLLREVPRKSLAAYHGKGDHRIEGVHYSSEEQAISINNTQCFKPVPDGVWAFRIGGYQVLDKYLKSRKGRTLSLDEINHVAAIADSLAFTIEQMAEIDKAYKTAFPGGG
jgi:Type ISP C-terminal specificity domain/N-6 DNA Methylase